MRTTYAHDSRGGFTLIEILVVIAIIGLLAGITLVGVNSIRKRNQRDVTKTTIRKLELVFQKYNDQTGGYPVEAVATDLYVNYGYLQNLKLEEAFGQPGADADSGSRELVSISNQYYVCDYWRQPILVQLSTGGSSPRMWSLGSPDSSEEIRNWEMR